MHVSRRNWIAAAGLAAAASKTRAAAPGLPDKSEFPVVKSEICLNNARWHPIGVGATRAVQQYLEYKATGGGASADYGGELQTRAKQQFAALIHAKPSEVAFVPSTTVGENLVAAALDLPRGGGRQPSGGDPVSTGDVHG